MHVFMLGWEYPPHISGGLGTACEGLTKALSKLGIGINFAVPHLTGDESSPHMKLFEPSPQNSSGSFRYVQENGIGSKKIEYLQVSAALNPYWDEEAFDQYASRLVYSSRPHLKSIKNGTAQSPEEKIYTHNLFDEVKLYSSNISKRVVDNSFDIIHMHDWMTFPAGVRLAAERKKPLIAHVHSVEYDRSGSNGNSQICEIEQYGLSRADSVIAVSHYTKEIINREYKIPKSKIYVVHNGVYSASAKKSYKASKAKASKEVLFLGRITFQKGPDYFVEAALKVIPKVPEVVFVMAGAGDMLEPMKRRVKEMNIENHFRFPGFLKGKQVEAAFSKADLYVMPSVSEPFGIAPLEAVSYQTPVIISKQSGVSEVLKHSLKTDFWDVDRMADLIINALLYPELRADISSMAKEELKSLRWEISASKVKNIYSNVLQQLKSL